jgi:RNA polymerase sigma-70 factor (ECF subfamily)
MQSRLSAAELRAAADAVVIALACAGDDQAFTEIVRRRHARVRRFMYRLCRRPALGDDLAQQVFLTAWRSLRQLRSAAAFDGWLKRIMITTWLEEVRRDKLEFAREPEEADFGAHRETTAERMDLDAALARLPAPARLCVVLAYDEGLSHPEIAALTGLPVGTVKSHISRGAARLRELLAEYEGV